MRSDGAIAYLSLPVDTDNSRGGFVWSGDKDGVAADAVHVDTGPGLYVVEMDVAVLGDQVDHVVLGTNLASKTKFV